MGPKCAFFPSSASCTCLHPSGVLDPETLNNPLVVCVYLRYLVNHWEMSKEYWYQRAIRNFSHFQRIVLEPAASLAQLLRIAFKTADIHEVDTASEESGTDGADNIDKKVEAAVALLVSKADMLEECVAASCLISPFGSSCVRSYRKGSVCAYCVARVQVFPNQFHSARYALAALFPFIERC